MTAKLFEAEAIRVLLGNRLLEKGALFRFHEKGESQGIYLSHLGEIGHLLPSEVRAITSGITSDNDASPRPLLTLPCTRADFMAFEDRVCYFRAHLEAGDETADLLREIASVNPDAGILACALMPGELPEDEEKLMLLPVKKTAPAAHQPQQAKPPRKPYRRTGWQQTPAFDYVVSVFASIAPVSCKELCSALRKAATGDFPVGVKLGCLFVRDTGKKLSDNTIANALPLIRAQAAKLPRDPHSPAKHSRG